MTSSWLLSDVIMTTSRLLPVLILLPQLALADITCNDIVCSSFQHCCTENGQTACCVKSSASALGIIFGILVAVALTATGVGICLYFKKRIHKDTLYTVEDIESMYTRSLRKEASCRVLETESVGPGSCCDPGSLSHPPPPIITPGLEVSEMRMPSVASGPIVSTQDKMTESASTQVTSAKRTVVTVNLNMKEKENIKLNIFMNKDKKSDDEDDRELATFPRGLSAKQAKKRALKRSASGGKGGKRPKSPIKEQPVARTPVKRKKSKQ